jgi:hypothetical protein
MDQNARAAQRKQLQDAVVSTDEHAVATLLLTSLVHQRTNFRDGRVSILLCSYLPMEQMPI